MSTYIIYNRDTGEIVHVHREYLQGSEETMELSRKEVLAQLKGLIPKGLKYEILATKEYPKPERGFNLHVDPGSRSLVRVKSTMNKANTRAGKSK